MIKWIANILLEVSWRVSSTVKTWLENAKQHRSSPPKWKNMTNVIQSLVEFEGLRSEFSPPQSVTAYRLAYLTWNPKNHIQFCSFTKSHFFGANQEIAQCFSAQFHKSGHAIPSEHCHCGYYSLIDPVKLPERTGNFANPELSVLLQVDLQGVIIPGFDGYRAEVQEVLKVWLTCSCYICHSLATRLQVKSTTRIDRTNLNGIFNLVLPVCGKHANSFEPYFTLDDIRSALGTEVAWM